MRCIFSILLLAMSVFCTYAASLDITYNKYLSLWSSLTSMYADITIGMPSGPSNNLQQATFYLKSKKARIDFSSPVASSMILFGTNVFIKNSGDSKYQAASQGNKAVWGEMLLAGMTLRETANNDQTISFSVFRDTTATNLFGYGVFDITSALLLEITTIELQRGYQIQTKSVFEYSLISGVPIPVIIRMTTSVAGQSFASTVTFSNVKLNTDISDSLFRVE